MDEQRTTAAAGVRWPGPPETAPADWERWWPFVQRAYLRTRPYPLFLRFGHPPRGPRSRTWYMDKHGRRFEPGVAVFRARRDEVRGAYAVEVRHPMLVAMWKVLERQARPAFLVTGKEVGRGSDSEPVLSDVRLIELPASTRIRAEGYPSFSVAASRVLCALNGWGDYLWQLDPPGEIVAGPPEGSSGYWHDPPRDVPAAIEAVLERSTSRASEVHGEAHWKRVAVAGARLVEETPGADPLVVFLFALLHDSMRLSDGEEYWHAVAANLLMLELLEHGEVVSYEQLDTLHLAIEIHDKGTMSDDPTVRCCFDADRLCLWRIGVKPDPRLLSTAAARRPETIEWARTLQRQTFAWEGILELYGLAGRAA